MDGMPSMQRIRVVSGKSSEVKMNFLQDRKVFMSQQQGGDDNEDGEIEDGPPIGLSPEAMAALLEFAQEKGCAVGMA